MILALFTQMYRYAAEPFFLANFKKEDFVRANAEAAKFFILVSIAIFLFVALYLDLFGLILGRDFRQGVFLLPVIMLANILAGTIVSLSFWYKQTGKTQIAILITGTGFVFTILLNFLLVPRLGYVGAAWARLGCEAVMVVLSYFLNQKYYPIPYDLKRIGSYFLLGGAIYATTIFTGGWPLWAQYPLNTLLLLLFLLYAVRRERIDVKGLFRSVLHRGKPA